MFEDKIRPNYENYICILDVLIHVTEQFGQTHLYNQECQLCESNLDLDWHNQVKLDVGRDYCIVLWENHRII